MIINIILSSHRKTYVCVMVVVVVIFAKLEPMLIICFFLLTIPLLSVKFLALLLVKTLVLS